jgi:predicted amidohydrolase YtcJ
VTGTVFRRVEVGGHVTDVRIDGAKVTVVGDDLMAAPDDEVIDGGGAGLLPGLHDHHVHLLAMAAAERSVRLGPPEVHDRPQLASALRQAATGTPPREWVRAVGYHESVAGELDRHALDGIVRDRPVRVQHRSGAQWVLNSEALAVLGIESATGRLVGADDWLRERLGNPDPPPLAPIGRRLSSYGVTGVTDATPSTELDAVETLSGAVERGELPQHVVVTGSADLASAPAMPAVRWGPVKIVLADHAFPTLDEVTDAMRAARAHHRPVAVHCVTAAALALALAAWGEVGAQDGDRVEHGSIVTPEAAAQLAQLGLTVVTQPGFVSERGDEYLADVELADLPHLYRCASLLRLGVEVAASTDAPFTHADPWRSVSAAIERRTPSGAVLGPDERLHPRRALALYLGRPDRPGGPARRVEVGSAADLCLLDGPLDDVLAEPSSEHVVATMVAGALVFRR